MRLFKKKPDTQALALELFDYPIAAFMLGVIRTEGRMEEKTLLKFVSDIRAKANPGEITYVLDTMYALKWLHDRGLVETIDLPNVHGLPIGRSPVESLTELGEIVADLVRV